MRAVPPTRPRPPTLPAVALKLARGRGGRLTTTLVAIATAVAFAAAIAVLTGSLRASTEAAVAGQARAADVVVTPLGRGDIGPAGHEIAAVRGVRAVEPVREAYLDVSIGTTATLGRVRSLPGTPELRTVTLVEGDWPGPGAVVVDQGTASDAGVGPGSSVALRSRDGASTSAVVSGLVELPVSFGDDLPTVLAADADVAAWTGANPTAIYVLGRDDPADLRAAVADAVDNGVVRTGAEQAERDVAAFTGDSDVLTTGLLGAAAVALAVAAMVIANTFRVVVAQRAGEFALLRCTGATRAQVARSVLIEATALAVLGAAPGAALGVGVGLGATALLAASSAGLPLTEITVPVPGVLTALAVGVLATLLAAIGPAREASRHRPLAALREVALSVGDSRPGRVRPACGALLLVAGAAALAFGASAGSVPITVAGGFLATAGTVLLSTLTTPALVRALRGPLARVAGPAGGLAWINLRRDPRRAAAASTALLVGVTLVATVLVGMATTRASLTSEVEARYPVDAEVLALRQPLPEELPPTLGSIDGVRVAAAVPGTSADIGSRTMTVLAVPDDVRGVARAGLVVPERGELLLPPSVARNNDIRAGETVPVRGPGGVADLRATLAAADLGAPLVSRADLTRLDPDPAVHGVWLRTEPDAAAAVVVEDVRRAMDASGAEAIVNGAVRLRDAYETGLTVAGLVALALLAVSVLIALVGITNTLTLSVLERKRESALLRALGLTRRGLRTSLAWEAAVLAVVAALLGVVLGSVFDVTAARSMLEFGDRTVPDLPVTRLAALVAATVLLAALASVIPARLAARVPPAQVLASE